MAELTITAVEVVPLRVPLSESPARRFAPRPDNGGVLEVTAVYIHTEDGPTGFGYTSQIGSRAGAAIAAYLRDELAPSVIGANALAPEAIWQAAWSPNKSRMRAGLAVQALSALDIACWDLVAKAAGLPLANLLGGYHSSLPVYGSGGTPNYTDAQLVEECCYFRDQGIGTYKFKIGYSPASEKHSSDAKRIALLRKEVGDEMVLLADAHQNYSVAEAIAASRMLADFGVAWLEEPVLADSISDLVAVAANSAVPLAAGENNYLRWEFRDLCARGAVAILQPDPVLCGGVTEMRRIAMLADAFGLSLCPHLCHELAVSLATAFPSGEMCEYYMQFPPEMWSRDFTPVNGRISAPDAPGHGLELGPTARARYGSE